MTVRLRESAGARLASLVRGGDARGCADFFRGQSEPERRHLAKRATELFDEQRALVLPGETPEERKRCLSAARLALLATASERNVHVNLLRHLPDGEHAAEACDVIADRWPAGASARDAIVQLIHGSAACWALTCALEERGIGPPPDSQTLVVGFVRSVAPGGAPLTDRLRHGCALHRVVWHFFDVPAAGAALEWHDTRYADRFSDAILALAAEGVLPRDRLLDGVLAALALGAPSASWFASVHERLAPSLEEQAPRREGYLRLLALKSEDTWAVALPALSRLLACGALPADRLLQAVEATLSRQTKKNVTRLFRVLQAAVASSTEGRATAVVAACAGLRHAAVDVQSLALGIIEGGGSREDGPLIERLRADLEYLAPSNKQRLRAWLGEPPPAESDGQGPTTDSRLEPELIARARAIPGHWARLAGVDAALASLEGRSPHVPLQLNPLAIPRLGTPIRLVSDLDELVDSLASGGRMAARCRRPRTSRRWHRPPLSTAPAGLRSADGPAATPLHRACP